MKKKTSWENWQELPGSFDTVNAKMVFASSHPLGIPDLAPLSGAENLLPHQPEQLIAYHSRRVRNEEVAKKSAIHFFVDDYHFESVWNQPVKSLLGLCKFGLLFTPNFSLYREWPLSVQIWNTYRSRWVGAWWQNQGLNVLPTVCWSTPASYSFCFAGIEPFSPVAITTLGVWPRTRTKPRPDQETNKNKNNSTPLRASSSRQPPSTAPQGLLLPGLEEPQPEPALPQVPEKDLAAETTTTVLFKAGFRRMLKTIAPSLVVCYGALSEELKELAWQQGTLIKEYPTRWDLIRAETRANASANTNLAPLKKTEQFEVVHASAL